MRVNRTLSSIHAAEDVTVAFSKLPGREGHHHFSGESKDDGEMIPAVALGSRLQATRPRSAKRMVVHYPRGDIEGMNVLFRDDIA